MVDTTSLKRQTVEVGYIRSFAKTHSTYVLTNHFELNAHKISRHRGFVFYYLDISIRYTDITLKKIEFLILIFRVRNELTHYTKSKYRNYLIK